MTWGMLTASAALTKRDASPSFLARSAMNALDIEGVRHDWTRALKCRRCSTPPFMDLVFGRRRSTGVTMRQTVQLATSQSRPAAAGTAYCPQARRSPRDRTQASRS